MKRQWIIAGLFLIALGTISVIAFWAPERDWDRGENRVEVVQAVDPEGNALEGGATIVVERGHRGFPFGLLLIPLAFILLFGLLRGGFRGPGGGGPWGPDGDRHSRWLDDWHARQHQEMTPGGPSPKTDAS